MPYCTNTAFKEKYVASAILYFGLILVKLYTVAYTSRWTVQGDVTPGCSLQHTFDSTHFDSIYDGATSRTQLRSEALPIVEGALGASHNLHSLRQSHSLSYSPREASISSLRVCQQRSECSKPCVCRSHGGQECCCPWRMGRLHLARHITWRGPLEQRDDWGVVPFVLEEVLKRASSDSNRQFLVSLSCVELYCEQLFDLLADSARGLPTGSAFACLPCEEA